MKKDKHITINIDDNDFNALKTLASKDNRNITNLCYLIIKDYLKQFNCANKKELQLFIINDYDDKRPMYYFLTDNVNMCYNLLEEIDCLEEKQDHWINLFLNKCIEENIYIKELEMIKNYDY